MSSMDAPVPSSEGQFPEKLDVSSEISLAKNEEVLESEAHSDKILEENLPENAKTGIDPESDAGSNQKSNVLETEESTDQKFHISNGSPRILEEDGWLDIIGSGDFKKRIIKGGNGVETRPKQGNSVILNYTCYKDDDNGDDVLVEKVENFEFFVGELDVVSGFDLAVPLMEEGEVAEILIPSRLAYGKLGRQPDIPGDCALKYEVEIVKVEEIDEEKLSPSHAMALGDKKRDRGNFWYGRGEYLNSVTCYKRATEVLDAIQWLNSEDNEETTPAIRQSVVEARIKVYNNIAAAQLKLESFDQALKSLDFVLRLQPKNVKAHYRKGKILSVKGMTDEAIAEMRKAAELEPETKVIQQELAKLLSKKKIEDKSQRAMYKRMFPESPKKSISTRSKIKQWLKHGSVMAGSCVALAIGVAAYRQYYS